MAFSTKPCVVLSPVSKVTIVFVSATCLPLSILPCVTSLITVLCCCLTFPVLFSASYSGNCHLLTFHCQRKWKPSEMSGIVRDHLAVSASSGPSPWLNPAVLPGALLSPQLSSVFVEARHRVSRLLWAMEVSRSACT